MNTLNQTFSQDKYGTLRSYQDKCETWEAVIALQLAKQFGLIASQDGGLSLDKDKVQLMPVEDVVQRSCDLAAGLVKEFEARGWLVEVRHPDEKI